MKVELSEQAEALVREQLAGGQYASPDEVVEDALMRLADDAEYWAEVGRMGRAGQESIEEGRFVELTPGLAEQIKREGRAKYEARHSASA